MSTPQLRNVPLTMAEYRCQIPLQVRFRDVDAMGHVNNAVFFSYFEIGRADYLKAIDYREARSDDMGVRFPFILAEVSCSYLAPAKLEDELTQCIRVDRIGRKSWGYQYLLARADGVAVATGSSAQVFYDYESQRSQPIPDWFAELIETYEGRSLRG